MAFMQIIDCKTDRFDDMNRLMDTWVEQTKGKRTATHAVVGRDRTDGSHYIEIVEFPSYEEAMQNSKLPETNRIFEEMVALCDGMPTFTDLDVVRDEQLNKAACRRFFEDVVGRGNLDAMDELFASDYRDHDPANDVDTVGADGMRQEWARYRDAFELSFTIDSQIADGDEVATRWTCHAVHHGDFKGVAATGRKVDFTGTTTFRFREGKIAEGWFHWDTLGLLRGIGAVETKR